MAIKFITRKQVEERLMEKWGEAIRVARDAGLPHRIPTWETYRNYELEALMRDNFSADDDWVICEWCPYDGIFCTYRHGASKHNLKEARRNFEDWRPEPGMPDMNKPYLYRLIDEQLANRPDELGEKQHWGRGIEEHYQELEEREGMK